jgi:hypothetical protein
MPVFPDADLFALMEARLGDRARMTLRLGQGGPLNEGLEKVYSAQIVLRQRVTVLAQAKLVN